MLSGRQGFTIIEVLAAIGIIVLIAILGIPAFRARQQSAQLSYDARTIVGGLRLAQQKTVTEQVTHLVLLTTDDPQNWKLVRRSGGDTVLDTQPLTSGITFQNTGGFANNEIVFTSTGAVVESGTVILQNAAGQTADIEIKPSGYVRTN